MTTDKNIVVGIDLGTTFSAIAHVDEFGRPQIIANSDSERITASVVMFEEEGVVTVGKMAKNNARAFPEKVVEYVKRQMGKSAEEWSFDVHGKPYRAEEISALILKRLKDDAEKVLGVPLKDAVITCPAYFNDLQRTATRRAGEIAGFNVLQIVDEPMAAAIAYGVDKAKKDETLLVFDLGGGTFDVTVVEVKVQGDARQINALAIDGDFMLGGKDWDDAIIKHVGEDFQAKYGEDPLVDLAVYQDIQLRAIEAKHALSKREKTVLVFSCQGKGHSVEITRDQFERMTENLIRECEQLSQKVLQAAKKTWKDIDKVLLVGGSTRMPKVKAMIQAISGKTPSEEMNPDEAVAVGAALQAFVTGVATGSIPKGSIAEKRLSKISTRKCSSHELGMIAWDQQHNDRVFEIIPKDKLLPFEKLDASFVTSAANQTSLLIRVTEGHPGETDPAKVKVIGEVTIEGLPAGRPAGCPIEVYMKLNEDGRLICRAKDVQSGKDVQAEIFREGAMTDAEAQKAAGNLQKIAVG